LERAWISPYRFLLRGRVNFLPAAVPVAIETSMAQAGKLGLIDQPIKNR
jgi:hypothetical protein